MADPTVGGRPRPAVTTTLRTTTLSSAQSATGACMIINHHELSFIAIVHAVATGLSIVLHAMYDHSTTLIVLHDTQ